MRQNWTYAADAAGSSSGLPVADGSELAKHFPDLAKQLHSIVRRLADLLPVVRRGVYHPDFEFSASIKTVAPALCPDFTYETSRKSPMAAPHQRPSG